VHTRYTLPTCAIVVATIKTYARFYEEFKLFYFLPKTFVLSPPLRYIYMYVDKMIYLGMF
jgi:hypothetical protein